MTAVADSRQPEELSWTELRRVRLHGYQRKSRFKLFYNLSTEQYEDMLKRQQGACAICGIVPEKTSQVHVDHDHESGAIRGLLCQRCNIGLGFFADSVNGLQRAIDYLKAPPGARSNEEIEAERLGSIDEARRIAAELAQREAEYKTEQARRVEAVRKAAANLRRVEAKKAREIAWIKRNEPHWSMRPPWKTGGRIRWIERPSDRTTLLRVLADFSKHQIATGIR